MGMTKSSSDDAKMTPARKKKKNKKKKKQQNYKNNNQELKKKKGHKNPKPTIFLHPEKPSLTKTHPGLPWLCLSTQAVP